MIKASVKKQLGYQQKFISSRLTSVKFFYKIMELFYKDQIINKVDPRIPQYKHWRRKVNLIFFN